MLEFSRFCAVGAVSSLLIAGVHATLAPRNSGLEVAIDLPSNWTYVGCYSDSTASRTLNGDTENGSDIDNEICITFCMNNDFTYAGTEYAGQYCDNILGEAGTVIDESDCDMACTGNANEACGGSNAISVYKGPTNTFVPTEITGWSYVGCYTDSVGGRTLANGVYPAGSLTLESCTSACKAAGYIIAGAEYGGECYCGDAYTNGGAEAPGGSGCTMQCNGNAEEICGGSNRLSVYEIDDSTPGSPTTGTPNPTASTTTTVASPTSTGSAVDLPTGWKYEGCYIDNANGRDFLYQQPDNSALTIESCVSTCISSGYSVAGMEYGVQCFCDDFLRNGAALTSDGNCNMACGGKASEKCGAGNRLSVYSNATLQVYLPPAPQSTSLPGSWKYQGCILDDAVNRTFFYQLILSDNNTATNCLTSCSEFGYNAGGLEYGDECYCGDVQNVIDLGRTNLEPESDCNSACSGNATFICGGGDRLSYYTWEGDPLYTWTFAQGNAAGLYSFIMSSPIIPLISSVALNSKVVFVEKYGTDPENNSSGTYEFDPSLAPDYATAFRELHVKSDVFCSASLVLPDKVGRQINIGGWANDATYGIRLYWPDGSPGVPGTNDWQENYQELMLQNGRWYPSAMTLANGSILVVGGEEGSNGAPVPTLELLPTVGPVVQCPYLARTDPYSTYPFLSVMPSGNIFIGYYNEARLLDPVSFETVKTLPNIPGQVNDFLAGRTYPFEGTMMLMPQYAPYTAPLTVLICGGSNPGPEYGVDNCVSTQPDAASPTWTIERMPSTRVIVCMVAMPDGTYLILNGGENGAAGFGLGRDPNHNAVLYNPTSTVGGRMTSMANTTISRLYHSEAVLMMDGTILVSGSDPEDNINPQEHRLEYFTPPYILSGAARPAFTITNKDWSYGETVSFTLTAGTAANIKVSLIAAVGSTHGNSMGQRTLFPASSCSGNTCTVQAPPNANISPPAWYQMWVLDGPTPSHATWVRIGGDPGKLGNWPDFPDFTVPGV